MLYPRDKAPQLPCLPRHDHGLLLHHVKRRLAARAGMVQPLRPGHLRGYVDSLGPNICTGWAQDSDALETPVHLDIFIEPANGTARRCGRVLANLFRADVRDAGYGSGNHGFEFKLPPGLAGRVSVRRAADGICLAKTAVQVIRAAA
jgi:hypothetical protein